MLNVKRQPYSIKLQKGQTMVFALVFIVVILIGVGILFNTGQLTRHKMEVQNAADAAAYSAAILTARELNFMAYTNRAMVANQVTLGQFAAFQSWGNKYAAGATGTTSAYAIMFATFFPIPYAGPTLYSIISNSFKGTLVIFDKINKQIAALMSGIGWAAERYIPVLQSFYVAHQKALKIATLATQKDMIPKVIDDNASGAQLSNFGALATFLSSKEHNLSNNFLKVSNKSNKQGKRRFAAFVNDSRDDWTKNRDRQLGFNLGSGPVDLFFADFYTKGYYGFNDIRGGTDLRFLGASEKYSWSSLDTVQGEVSIGFELIFKEICLVWYYDFWDDMRWECGKRGKLSKDIKPPSIGLSGLSFAGAAAEALEDKNVKLFKNIPKWKKGDYGGAWSNPSLAATEALIRPEGYQLPNKSFRGLPSYIDINPEKYAATNSAPTFIVSVRKNGDILKTSDSIDNNIKMLDGEFDITTKLAGGREGYGDTNEGDPGNILGKYISEIVDSFKRDLLDSTKTPGGIGDAAVATLINQFEAAIKDKIDELQVMLNDSIPNTAARKGGIFALAAAEVYFKNPDENARQVNGSTFSPYWQVRLTPVDDSIRRWSVISQGLLLDSPNKSLIKEDHLKNLSIMGQK